MMTITQPVEYCSKCGEPTGRAGRYEDSIYIGEIGPLCEDCADGFETIPTCDVCGLVDHHCRGGACPACNRKIQEVQG